MPRTNTEIDADLTALARKVADLDKDAAVRQARAAGLETRTDEVATALKQTADVLAEHRRLADGRMDVLEEKVAKQGQELAELRMQRDEWAGRFWNLLFPVAAAVIGGFVLYLLGFRRP